MNFLSVQVSNIKLLTTIIRIMSKDMIVLFLTVSVPLWIVESAILLNIQNKRAYIVWAIHESPVIAAGASPRPTVYIAKAAPRCRLLNISYRLFRIFTRFCAAASKAASGVAKVM